jgi:beta-N-acetylhexosaminidase
MNLKRSIVSILLIISFQFDAEAQVTLRQKIGQMIMVTFTGDSLEKRTASIDTLKNDLADGLIGGVTYFTWSNNLKNPAQITRLSGQLQQNAKIPLLIATDQEGGKVARLSASNGFQSSKTAYQLGTIINKEDSTRVQAFMMAGWLKQSGINTDFAPVADVNVNPLSPAIGALERSFSAKPDSVTAHIGWFIDEMRKKNIITTVKHFPGHGSATADSHNELPDISTTWTTQELIPFQSVISNRTAEIVMMGHLFNKTLDSLYPTSLSNNVVTNLLRNQMGFDGVVITDAMSMAAISKYYGFTESIVLAVNAGVNLLLYTTNFDSLNRSLARTIVGLIEQKVQAGIISETRIEDSYTRIMKLKTKYLGVTFAQLENTINQPKTITLKNYPNPFNAETILQYELPQSGRIHLKIYDLLGREVSVLKDEEVRQGVYAVRWNASSFASGVYIAVLTTPTSVIKQKLVLMK